MIDPYARPHALPRMGVLRNLTDQTVLDLIYDDSRITRAEIARRSGISKPTVAESIRRLERAELVRAAGPEGGRPGRIATFYELSPAAGYVLGVDLGPSAIRISTADVFGRTMFSIVKPTTSRAPAAEVQKQLRDVVAGVMQRAGKNSRALVAVTIGVANPVTHGGRVVALPEAPFPEGLFQPVEVLRDLVSVPIQVENDVNLAALAERAHGVAVGVDDFAYLFIGEGSGLGVVLGGELHRGAAGLAGEVGYLPTGDENGGAWAPRHGFARALARRGLGLPSGRLDRRHSLARAARRAVVEAHAGDAEAQAVLERAARCIGEAVVAVSTVLDPSLVVLGGPIGSIPELLEPVRATVGDLAPSQPQLEITSLGDEAVLLGAMAMAVGTGRRGLLERVGRT